MTLRSKDYLASEDGAPRWSDNMSAVTSRRCAGCGTEFTPRRKDQNACSSACSSSAHVRVHRDKLNAARRTQARAVLGLPADTSETVLRRIVARRRRGVVVVSYQTAHKRVQSERGPAAAHPCVDCRRPAEEWSYTHDDPSGLAQVIIDTRSRAAQREAALSYSADPAYYVPRCVSCHIKFDQRRLSTG